MDEFFIFPAVAVQSSIIHKDAVHRAVSVLLGADEVGKQSPDTITSTSAPRIIDVFGITRFRYDPIKKIFYQYVSSSSSPPSPFILSE